MADLTLNSLSEIPQEELLKVKRNDHEFTVSGVIRSVKFRDQDTRQMVIYIPSLDVSGYGATTSKALEMVTFCAKDLFDFWATLSPKQLSAELKTLGWGQDKYFHKKFSKIFVDTEGDLKNFNAVADEVEVEALSL